MKRVLGWLAGSPSVMRQRQDWQFNWNLGFMSCDFFLVNKFLGGFGGGVEGEGLGGVAEMVPSRENDITAGGCRLRSCDETVTQTYGSSF